MRGIPARSAAALLCAAALILSLSGCSFHFVTSPDELYRLPQLPAQYTELEKSLDAVQTGGAEYAAPLSGTNIQPVQLMDLDGDGQEEAVAFFRKSSDEKPLKIYIFTAKDGAYVQTAVIEGSGSAVYSIAYSDLDRDGRLELIVGWKVGTELQALSVYSLRGAEPEELMHTNYVKYALADLNQDKRQELVVFHADAEGSSVADLYTWVPGASLSLASTARISVTMAELGAGRVRGGTLRGGTPALFVSGVENSSTEITDILAIRQNGFVNLALSDVTGVSTQIYRYLTLYPTDINDDGITEVPAPVSLPTRSDDERTPCYQTNWLSYGADGSVKTAYSTYHDTDDGWYLVLPDAWKDRIAVSRSQSGPGEMVVTFSTRGAAGVPPQDFLAIYTITGESRESRALRDSRFVLSRLAETIFSAKLLDGSGEMGLTEDSLRSAFSLITTEWVAGDN
jgi:hypothetical protein